MREIVNSYTHEKKGAPANQLSPRRRGERKAANTHHSRGKQNNIKAAICITSRMHLGTAGPPWPTYTDGFISGQRYVYFGIEYVSDVRGEFNELKR